MNGILKKKFEVNFMYKKIVTVVDVFGEPNGVLAEVITMSQRENSELHLLINKPEIEALEQLNYLPYDSGMYMPYEYDMIKENDENYQKDVDKVISKVKAEGVDKLVTTIYSGSTKSFINKYIEKNSMDLIVLGSYDELLSKRELESVAKHVIKNTTSNLLILR